MKTLECTSTLGAHVYIRTSGSRSELSASGTELHSSHSSGPEGREFESPRAHHSLNLNDLIGVNFTGTVWPANQKVGNSSPLRKSR